MKKVFAIMLVASAFITVSASAQSPSESKPMKNRGGMQKQVLMDSLKLTEVNADSVISIRTQGMTQIRDIMKDQTMSEDQKKEKIKPIKEEMKKRLSTYLTKDQMEKLQQMQGGMKREKADK